MAKVRLVAATPKLDKALQKLVSGAYDTTELEEKPIPHKEQKVWSNIPQAGGDNGPTLGVLTSGPNGYGPAIWKAITIKADGTWEITGAETPVVVPLLK